MRGRFAAFWRARRAHLLELFLVGNLAFLAVDILLAHAVNRFARWQEWIPFGFSVTAALALFPAALVSWRRESLIAGRRLVGFFGTLSVAVGVAGLAYHLESQFLREQTLKHLVYTAPFAAPLAYCGIGTLLVLNRRYGGEAGWAYGVLFGALGGFFGNFVLALADHAQNGFFHPVEWLAVAAPALATGFLAVLILSGVRSPVFAAWVGGVLVLQCVVGGVGFVLHNAANWPENFIHGAPAFAPLLFINISILAAIGLVDRLVEYR